MNSSRITLRLQSLFFLLATFVSFGVAQSKDPVPTVHHWETAIYDSDTWRYLVPKTKVSANWRLMNFDDSTWSQGKGGFGYGPGIHGTTIWKRSNGARPSAVFMRKVFQAVDTSKISIAVLHVDYDDAFVAFLNGVEIASSGLFSALPAFDELGVDHDAAMHYGGQPEEFIISPAKLKSIITKGANILSVQVHNSSLNSSDMSSNVFLSFGIKDASTMFWPTPNWFEEPSFEDFKTKLPLILINTASVIPDEPKVTANMKIIYHADGSYNYESDEANIYDGFIGIERRGSSSYNFPQRPYGLETRDEIGQNLDTALLDMPSENDWVLLSNYNDKSFARNILAFELFQKMGHYAPRMRLAEMLMNGTYQGVYLFGEKIKRDKGRVAIAKLAEKDTVGTGLTGGYIFKTDYDDGYGTYWTSKFSPLNRPYHYPKFNYYDPKPKDLLWQQMEYISGYVDMLETVLYSDIFPHPTYGYRAYLDVNSFIDYFILTELSRNVDGYKKSRFFYKDKDSNNPLVHSGPAWDYDWAWKNLNDCSFLKNTTGAGWAYKINECNVTPVPPSWEVRMLQDPAFVKALNKRYFSLRNSILSVESLNAMVDSVASLVDEAEARHFKKFKILGYNNSAPEIDAIPTTYAGEVEKLKNWIEVRLAWLDKNMYGEPSSVDDVDLSPRLRVFPNPVQKTLYVESDQVISHIVLTNTMGMIVQTIIPTELSTGIDLSNLNAGVYMLRVELESGKSYTQKILKK